MRSTTSSPTEPAMARISSACARAWLLIMIRVSDIGRNPCGGTTGFPRGRHAVKRESRRPCFPAPACECFPDTGRNRHPGGHRDEFEDPDPRPGRGPAGRPVRGRHVHQPGQRASRPCRRHAAGRHDPVGTRPGPGRPAGFQGPPRRRAGGREEGAGRIREGSRHQGAATPGCRDRPGRPTRRRPTLVRSPPPRRRPRPPGWPTRRRPGSWRPSSRGTEGLGRAGRKLSPSAESGLG